MNQSGGNIAAIPAAIKVIDIVPSGVAPLFPER